MSDLHTEQVAVAWFVTPHGLGHAARAAAIMDALQAITPSLELHVFTTVPEAFFRDSLAGRFFYHSVETDVGLVQSSSLREDLPASAARLGEFLPFDPRLVDELARTLVELDCRLAVADIAPLGIAVARKAEVASVLTENFTWDWIYEGYAAQTDVLQPYVDYLRQHFEMADHHVQTVPVCFPSPDATVVPPVSRRPRQSREETRRDIGVALDARVVLVSMGGIPETCGHEDRLSAVSDTVFLVPGTGRTLERRRNVLLIPFHAGIYHPDLVQACDAVVGKVGYSTMAEVYHAGVPFAYVRRSHFREAKTLSGFIAEEFNGIPLTPVQFEDGSWIDCVPELLSMPSIDRSEPNGSEIAAAVLGGYLSPF